MARSRNTPRFAGVFVLAAVALLGTSTAATAATGLMPVGTPVPTGPHKTTTAEYDCDLSPYGYQSGTDQITMDVSTTAFESAVQGTTRT